MSAILLKHRTDQPLAVKKDPLQVSKSETALALLGTANALFECVVQPALAIQTAGLFQAGLLCVNFATDAALNYQAYQQLKPKTKWEKAAFITTSLASIPLHMGLARLPRIKIGWDLMRCGLVAHRSISQMWSASTHYAQDKWKAVKHAGVHTANLGTALFQTRRSIATASNVAKNALASIWKSWNEFSLLPQVGAAPLCSGNGECSNEPVFTDPTFCSYDQTGRLECEAADSSEPTHTSKTETLLEDRVRKALANGGNLNWIQSNSGVYIVNDSKGKPIAVFKPSDERNMGPNNRNPLQRGPVPTEEQIYFNQMTSFEQGKPAERQSLAKRLERGCYAMTPAGAAVQLESDLFVDPDCLSGQCPPRKLTKSGFLQEWAGPKKNLAKFHPEIGDANLTSDTAYRFQNHPMLDQISANEFQKVGIMDVLLYNEDRNLGNLLVDHDDCGTPHLIPIDSDSILPYKLQEIRSLLTHPRAAEPFTDESLKMIASYNPIEVAETIRKSGVGEQASTNGRALALVLNKFAAAGKTLKDIFEFVSTSDPTGTSKLWKLMTEMHPEALASLSKEDLAMLKHNEHLNWLQMQNRPLPEDSGAPWLEYYRTKHRERIESSISALFWSHLENKIDTYLS